MFSVCVCYPQTGTLGVTGATAQPIQAVVVLEPKPENALAMGTAVREPTTPVPAALSVATVSL